MAEQQRKPGKAPADSSTPPPPVSSEEDAYDQVLEDSFPASDPPAGPTHIGPSRRPGQGGNKSGQAA